MTTRRQPYTAISDGEIRESSLLSLLTSGRAISGDSAREIPAPAPVIDVEAARIGDPRGGRRLRAQRAAGRSSRDARGSRVRVIGRDKTVGTNLGRLWLRSAICCSPICRTTSI